MTVQFCDGPLMGGTTELEAPRAPGRIVMPISPSGSEADVVYEFVAVEEGIACYLSRELGDDAVFVGRMGHA